VLGVFSSRELAILAARKFADGLGRGGRPDELLLFSAPMDALADQQSRHDNRQTPTIWHRGRWLDDVMDEGGKGKLKNRSPYGEKTADKYDAPRTRKGTSDAKRRASKEDRRAGKKDAKAQDDE